MVLITVNIKWDKEFVAFGESEEDEQLLKKTFVESRDSTEGGLEAGYARILKEN